MAAFALISALPVIVLGWGIARELRHTVETRALDSFTSSTRATTQVVATAFLDRGLSSDLLERVDVLADELAASFAVDARFRLVLPNGLVGYASEPEERGLAVLTPAAVDALKGISSGTFLEERPSWLRSKHRPFAIWVPVTVGQRQIGAMEMVGASARLSEGISQDVRRITIGLAIGLAVLWLTLLPIVGSIGRRLERQAEDNRRLAERDPLTGLVNRNVLHERLSSVLERQPHTRVGLLLIDLDDFKNVNDTLGHSHGDRLLLHVAGTLTSCTREDDIVARLGGDEFAIVVVGPTDRELEELAERILTTLRNPLTIDGVDVDVDASIGIALSPDDGETAELLLQHADIAMYAAKQAFIGHRRYDTEIDLHSPSRLALASELKRGMSAGEIELFYQPIANATTREIVCVEALVRWRHPVRGLISPSEFLPLAERSGLVHRLTGQVFERALQQQREWLDAGIEVTISVNLSAADLRGDAIVDRIKSLLARYRVPARLLQVELTEQGLLRDPDSALLVLARLQGLGARIALDDFGVGASSLTYLRNIHADALKIDRSFVSDLAESETNASIVRSLVDLAHVLGMEVTGEGVETDVQWRRLEALGCDLVQGYHLARPLPADSITALLHASSAASAA